MKKALQLVLFLGIVCLVSGLAVGYVNGITAPIIEESLLASEIENLEAMYPNAEFSALDVDDDTGIVTGAYEVEGEGYVVKVEVTGYNSSTPIIALIGFDSEGTITGFMVIQQQETSGFGSLVFEEDNIDSLFVGKTLSEESDLLSGATVTSRAMQNAVAAAQAVVEGIIA